MKKFIITGGPHTGKTTLLGALEKVLPELCFVPEPAVAVIEEEFAKEKADANYAGIFPWNRYPEFRQLVIKKSRDLEAGIPEGTELSILDRSLVDNVAYTRLNKMSHLLDDLVSPIKEAEYYQAFICDFVGTYTQTKERWETFEQAQQIHLEIVKAYGEADMRLQYLPAVSVEERVKMVVESLGALS